MSDTPDILRGVTIGDDEARTVRAEISRRPAYRRTRCDVCAGPIEQDEEYVRSGRYWKAHPECARDDRAKWETDH